MQSRTHVSNVLVIGTGAAGLRAAIAAYEAGCDVVLVGKSLKRDAYRPSRRWDQRGVGHGGS
ncbi:FAD-binding protein [Candidatus Flexifilum breve]|uniref:FAD-binding protein n=1 Tax=Candidatus Flexifilum breve TaxID=3140694 RepID=UPI0031CC4F34